MAIQLDKYGRIPFTITISLSAHVPTGTDLSTLTDQQALNLCRETLGEYAEGNDGSEILANAKPTLVK